LVFGFDCISRFTTTGFHSLSALSETGARPFDAERDGLTLGEGAAFAVLSFKEPKKGDITVIGGGSSNDANHRTGPSRSGEGLYRAAKEAVSDADIKPDQIGVVKCHGTATDFNDAMEAKALHLLFGEKYPPSICFKGAIGHLSGVSSLVEIIITGECLKKGVLPPTVGYKKHGVDEPVKISSKSQPVKKPTALCLSAGFGGLNSAVVIREHR
jgi:3-oxoacyl-[acyl-carrier-protein] synthase-1